MSDRNPNPRRHLLVRALNSMHRGLGRRTLTQWQHLRRRLIERLTDTQTL